MVMPNCTVSPMGIANGGNTCFIASSLQMLLAADQFRNYMLTDKPSTQAWKPVPPLPLNAGVSAIYKEGVGVVISELAIQLCSNELASIDPHSPPWSALLPALSIDYKPQPGCLQGQQCASEFTNLLLQYLDMELSPIQTSRLNRNMTLHRKWFDADNALFEDDDTVPPTRLPNS